MIHVSYNSITFAPGFESEPVEIGCEDNDYYVS